MPVDQPPRPSVQAILVPLAVEVRYERPHRPPIPPRKTRFWVALKPVPVMVMGTLPEPEEGEMEVMVGAPVEAVMLYVREAELPEALLA